MVGSAPRFPLRGLLLIGLGFLLASMIGSTASTVGSIASAVLFIPLLILKVLFFLFLFSMFFRLVGAFAGGGRGPWGHPGWGHHHGDHHRHGDRRSDDRGAGPGRRSRRRGRWADGGRGEWGGRRSGGMTTDPGHWTYQGRPMSGPKPPAPSRDDAEWEESLRQARREVDDLDAPYREPEATVADTPDGPARTATGADDTPADAADVDPGAEGPRD